MVRYKDRKVPPIVVQGTTLTQGIMGALSEHTNEKFTVEHKPNSTIVYAQNMDDFTTIKKLLYDTKFQFHSFTPNAEKTHAFIFKAIDQPQNLKTPKRHLSMNTKSQR
ncbi:hypothetical protein JTB14_028980 [Gonioctena quinquepunctata]|nr:hypothetical protein JTB14_028980 [Gonioctena quinquepunctata]